MMDDRSAVRVGGDAASLPAAQGLLPAQRQLIANFRSMAVSLKGPEAAVDAGAPRRLPAAVIARWLKEYQVALFAANHALHGDRPHALRARTLTFAGDAHLAFPDDVLVMAKPALDAGMSVLLGVTLDAISTHAGALASLREALPALSLTVDFSAVDGSGRPEERERLRAALEKHIGAGGEIYLSGELASLRATGLLEREAGNRTFMQIHAPSLHGLRPAHRRHDFAPCGPFFALHVDEAGDVYPCAGMAGHRPARLGSVHQPFDQVLQSLAACEAQIESLAHRGPRIADEHASYPADLCALHRRAVGELTQL